MIDGLTRRLEARRIAITTSIGLRTSHSALKIHTVEVPPSLGRCSRVSVVAEQRLCKTSIPSSGSPAHARHTGRYLGD